jgi:hypothetical protein
LTHSISAAGSRPLEDKAAGVQFFLQPTTAKELQRFVSTVKFYRCVLPQHGLHPGPLTTAMRGSTLKELLPSTGQLTRILLSPAKRHLRPWHQPWLIRR